MPLPCDHAQIGNYEDVLCGKSAEYFYEAAADQQVFARCSQHWIPRVAEQGIRAIPEAEYRRRSAPEQQPSTRVVEAVVQVFRPLDTINITVVQAEPPTVWSRLRKPDV